MLEVSLLKTALQVTVQKLIILRLQIGLDYNGEKHQ